MSVSFVRERRLAKGRSSATFVVSIGTWRRRVSPRFDLFAGHVGVALESRPLEATLLQLAALDDAVADDLAGLACPAGLEHLVLRQARILDASVKRLDYNGAVHLALNLKQRTHQ